MNKYFFFGAVAVLALLVTAFGAWTRITHQPYSDTAMAIGRISRIIGILALAWLLFLWLKKK
jgi:nitrate reductase gamma subunit